MMILFLSVFLQFDNVRSLITTAVFKRQAPTEVGSTSTFQRFMCSFASLESQYKGFNIEENTGDCTRILNEIVNPNNYTKKDNEFIFLPPVPLYKNSATDKSLYLSEIPGGVVIGLSIDVNLQPVDPWTQLVIALTEETLQTRPLHFALRNDLDVVNFNIKEDGSFGPGENANPPGGFIYENNDVYKFTIVVTATHYQIPLYKASATNRSFYLSEIPGGMVTGLSLDVILQPVDPWTQIVIALCDETLDTRPLHIALRSDLDVVKFSYKEDGIFYLVEHYSPLGGFIYTNNDVYKFTVTATDTHFEVQSNGTQLYDFAYILDKNIASHLYVYAAGGSFATVYEVAFHLPES